MVWTLDMDDSKNYCGAEKYPLMKKINEELQGYRVKLEYKGPFDTSGGFLSKKSLPTKQNGIIIIILVFWLLNFARI